MTRVKRLLGRRGEEEKIDLQGECLLCVCLFTRELNEEEGERAKCERRKVLWKRMQSMISDLTIGNYPLFKAFIERRTRTIYRCLASFLVRARRRGVVASSLLRRCQSLAHSPITLITIRKISNRSRLPIYPYRVRPPSKRGMGMCQWKKHGQLTDTM